LAFSKLSSQLFEEANVITGYTRSLSGGRDLWQPSFLQAERRGCYCKRMIDNMIAAHGMARRVCAGVFADPGDVPCAADTGMNVGGSGSFGRTLAFVGLGCLNCRFSASQSFPFTRSYPGIRLGYSTRLPF
jgi:hypothetical protein